MHYKGYTLLECHTYSNESGVFAAFIDYKALEGFYGAGGFIVRCVTAKVPSLQWRWGENVTSISNIQFSHSNGFAT